MNLFASDAYVYGPGNGLTRQQQELGYQRIFALFHKVFNQYPTTLTELIFSPSVLQPFENYYPLDENGSGLAGGAGPDGYDLFPNTWLHPYYWLYGKRSAEEIFLPSLLKLKELGGEEAKLYICEIGSLGMNLEFLQHAALLLFALGGDAIMYFNYDKRRKKKLYERDWTLHAKQWFEAFGFISRFGQTAQRPVVHNEVIF